MERTGDSRPNPRRPHPIRSFHEIEQHISKYIQSLPDAANLKFLCRMDLEKMRIELYDDTEDKWIKSGYCRSSYSMMPKAILQIMDTSSSDASSIDCPLVYTADWDTERLYKWLSSSPVLRCISNESTIYGDCWSPISSRTESIGSPRTIRHSEERHDPKIYALDMTQLRTPGDAGDSETSPPPLFLDSGATHHVVKDFGILSNTCYPLTGMSVAVADGFRLQVTKAGDIQLPHFKIPGVYFVPGLNRNLISVFQLAKNKITSTFYEHYAELWLEGEPIGGAIVDGRLYKLRYLELI